MATHDVLTPPTTMHALPPETSSVLTSAQLLTSPTAVAKELIDNALDAHATSLGLKISANTIDLIQLRDNGHGIPPADRPLAARRHCTSKIRCLTDVARLGGTSLGFRGEALAAVAESAGTLQIVTRVAGETVGSVMETGENGELKGQPGRKSHPVGTTVTAKRFFDRFPVRKQAALKHADRFIGQIKKLMMAYAVARPEVRFQLKIVKGKGKAGAARGDWVYAPSPGKTSMQDACLRVFGVGCANQCNLVVSEEEGFVVEGLVPKKDGDATKIVGIGQFVSVDSRPVATSKATLKKVVELFKERLKRSGKAFEGLRDPFLRLDIKCPPEAYDPNVEPAKDDVLFMDSGLVLRVVENFFKKALPDQEELEQQPSETTGDFEMDLLESLPSPDTPGLRRLQWQMDISRSPPQEPTSPNGFTLPIRSDQSTKAPNVVPIDQDENMDDHMQDEAMCRKEFIVPIRSDYGIDPSKLVLFDQSKGVDELSLLYERQILLGSRVATPSSESSHTIAESDHCTPEPNADDADPCRAEEQDGISDRPLKRRRTWKSNMFDFDMEDLPQENTDFSLPPEPQEVDMDDVGGHKSGVALSNPWTMAKMNTPTTRSSSVSLISQRPTPLGERSPARVNAPPNTPRFSSPLRNVQLSSPQTPSPRKPIDLARDDFEMEQNIRRFPPSSKTPREHQSIRVSPSSPIRPGNQNSGFQPMSGFVPINRPRNGTDIRTDSALPTEPQQSENRRKRPAGRVNKSFKSPIVHQNPTTSATTNSRQAGKRVNPQSFVPESQGNGMRHNSADGPDPIFNDPEREPNHDIRNFMTTRTRGRQAAAVTPPVVDQNDTVDQVPQVARQTRNSLAAASPLNSTDSDHQEHQTLMSQGESPRRVSDRTERPQEPDESSAPHGQRLAEPSPQAQGLPTRQLRPRPAPSNASIEQSPSDEDRGSTSARRSSNRRRTRTRTKSRTAHLPLKRTPSGAPLQNLHLTLNPGSVSSIAADSRRLDPQLDYPDYTQDAEEAYDCFAREELRRADPETVMALSARLRTCVQKAGAKEGRSVVDVEVFEEVVAAALSRERREESEESEEGACSESVEATEDDEMIFID